MSNKRRVAQVHLDKARLLDIRSVFTARRQELQQMLEDESVISVQGNNGSMAYLVGVLRGLEDHFDDLIMERGTAKVTFELSTKPRCYTLFEETQ